MRASVFCFLVLCSLSIASSYVEATKSLGGFSIDLIHRDSPLSPFYNPSLTPLERIKNVAMRSIARSNHISLSQNKKNSLGTTSIPDPETGEYIMRFYIGTPPVERFAIADTGSDLIWVQCSPCKRCSPQTTPLFNPKKSSTFRKVPCDTQPCTLLSHNERRCGNSGECKYLYQYGDSYVLGNLGVESINFGSKGGSKAVKFPKLTFGCTYNNSDVQDNETKLRNTGLVGLGGGPLSLISQLADEIGHKFSYCFPPLGSNFSTKLNFGNEATLKAKKVVSTPLITKTSVVTYYYLNLEGVSVAKKLIKIRKSQVEGNILIDSGTTYSMLPRSYYNKFVKLVEKVYGKAVKNPPDPFDTCFSLGEDSDDHDDDDDSRVVFHFTGAKVRLSLANLLRPYENLFCLMIQPTSDHGLAVFGNQQQIGFEVEYDLEEGKVSFAPASQYCAKH